MIHIIKKIQTWVNKYKKQQQEKYIDSILQKFHIKERGVNLYIMVEDRAIKKLEMDCTVKQALQQLQSIRMDQLAYLNSDR